MTEKEISKEFEKFPLVVLLTIRDAMLLAHTYKLTKPVDDNFALLDSMVCAAINKKVKE